MRKPPVQLAGEVEYDEVYGVAGHKGIPAAIKNRDPRRNRLKGARGRGTLATEKPPIFGMVQRDGQVRIVMLPNVRQKTIKPFIEQTISKGTLIYTDEYAIYSLGLLRAGRRWRLAMAFTKFMLNMSSKHDMSQEKLATTNPETV
ncbi:MAG: transposase [Methylococcales bacterium]